MTADDIIARMAADQDARVARYGATRDPLAARLAVVCADCGLQSTAACPYGAVDCSECSFLRERSVAGVSDDIPQCPAHGAYLDDPEPRS